jgi:glycosyltransferase involved in cell wall biosynthesis
MSQPAPKITVVMPSYNQGRYLEAAILSVTGQDYPNFEFIVMDGGSDDESVQIIKRHEQNIDYWVSQKDAGQSDAINRGFERASGHILTWLNSDDLLMPGALREVGEAFLANPDYQWLFGNVVWIDADDRILRCRKGGKYRSVLPRMGILAAYGPSAFFSKDLYNKVGGLNGDFHYMMDTELWWKFIINGASFHRLRRYNWALRLHAEAKVSGHLFGDGNNEKQEKTSRAQRAENALMNRMIVEHCRPLPPFAAKLLHNAMRLSSPQYIKGQYDNLRWRGHRIEELAEKQ